jgi:hypothetical protein
MNANCEIAQTSLNISFKTLSIYMKKVEDSCGGSNSQIERIKRSPFVAITLELSQTQE